MMAPLMKSLCAEHSADQVQDIIGRDEAPPKPHPGGLLQLAQATSVLANELHRRLTFHAGERVSFLIAEQNTNIALRYADYGYILENGRVMMDGAAQDLAQNEDVKEFYLGISSGERKSFRDNKFYRRRKRWLA